MENDYKENILGIANSMLQEGKRIEAEKLLNDFVSEMPPDWKPIMESETSIDITYWSLEEFLSHTAHYIKDGSKKNLQWVGPSYSKMFYTLAFICVEQQDWSKAMLYIQQATELEPDHPMILCEKAMILSHQGLNQEAYDLFLKASEIRSWAPKPQQAKALRGAAVALIDLNRLDDAEDYLKKSLEIEPENEVALNELKYIERLRTDQIKQEQKDVKCSILCVDDEQLIADYLCSFLNDQKYKTFSAYSAEEALEVLSKHHIDLVITDVIMPGMNGLELSEIIKENFDSDVIVMSGYKEAGFDEKAMNIGANDFLL